MQCVLNQGQDVPVGITESLLVLIQEENTIRARLEQDLGELSKDLNTLSLLQNNGRFITQTPCCQWQHKEDVFIVGYFWLPT